MATRKTRDERFIDLLLSGDYIFDELLMAFRRDCSQIRFDTENIGLDFVTSTITEDALEAGILADIERTSYDEDKFQHSIGSVSQASMRYEAIKGDDS